MMSASRSGQQWPAIISGGQPAACGGGGGRREESCVKRNQR